MYELSQKNTQEVAGGFVGTAAAVVLGSIGTLYVMTREVSVSHEEVTYTPVYNSFGEHEGDIKDTWKVTEKVPLYKAIFG